MLIISRNFMKDESHEISFMIVSRDLKLCIPRGSAQPSTVGENIIATTKRRNNYDAIQSFIFPILR